jgi:tetratricopeptide (TPR) repeat protein
MRMRLGHRGLSAVLLCAALAGPALAGEPVRAYNADSLMAEAEKAMAKGEYESAAKKLNIVLARESRHNQARYRLAEAYLELGRLHSARRHFRLALSGNPDNAEWVANCRVQIGRTWELAGDYREALTEYQLALKAKPTYTDAVAGRTRALAQKSD